MRPPPARTGAGRSPMTSYLSRVAPAVLIAACATEQKKADAAVTENKPPVESPLLAPWQGPWGGVPPFGKFKVKDIQTAMNEGMAQNLAKSDQTPPPPNP